MITTHVLDTARGRPAAGVPVRLERAEPEDRWHEIGNGETDADGRLRSLVPAGVSLQPGRYRLVFDTRRYYDAQQTSTFYPLVMIVFETLPGEAHYHVPLLLGPFGYTTYRGS
jgi:5-hydroxyisourate hydrolase